MKIIRNLLLVFFSGLLVFSAWQIIGILRSYQTGQDSYTALDQYVSFTEPPAQPPETESAMEVEEEATAAPTEEPDDTLWPSVDFEQLAQINPDIVGWIYIEGTTINYPVVQTGDNSYYLNHLFDGTVNRAGCIFLDAANSAGFSDRNSIIYGHHLKDQSMFTCLMKYKQQSYYEEHPVALLLTPDCKYKIQLFSGYVSDTASGAWDKDFSDGSFGDWLSAIKEKSCFTSEFTPTEDDRIVTLSTCTYEFNNARFVMHGYIAKSIKN